MVSSIVGVYWYPEGGEGEGGVREAKRDREPGHVFLRSITSSHLPLSLTSSLLIHLFKSH